jgi:hypothetical protein
MQSRAESYICSLIVAYFQWHQAQVNRASTGAAIWATVKGGLIALLIFFIWNSLRSSNLQDKPRRLSHWKKRRITEHLRPYSHLGGKDDRIVTLAYQKGVKDAEVFGTDICDALREAGWAVDILDTDQIMEQRHSKGIWLYGKGAFSFYKPITADLLQDAFKAAGVRLRLDQQDPTPDVNMVIGEQEDKCFNISWLGAVK